MDSNILDKELNVEISLYARISVDTEKESDENTSIENQLKIMRNFVKQSFPKCSVREYIDKDKSGYTFEQRENYQDMRRALLSGKSKILVVKDFSRFSRRTSLGLWELEQMRDAGVRIISIMDGCDFPTHDDWLNISVRFMTNELPVTETSKKVRKSIKAMQEEGDWLCAVPYGYILKTVFNKQVVEIVPDEAEIVKEIFRLYAYEGRGYDTIAKILTEKNIPTPRMKEKERAEQQGKVYKRQVGKEWNSGTLEGLLRNDFYIGIYRGNKYTRNGINGSDKKTNKDEHIVIPNHHASIIDDKLFFFTQTQLELRCGEHTHYRGVKKYPTPYTGYLFCGDCNSPMFSRSRTDLAPSYICGGYQKNSKGGCTTHHTRVDFLDSVLKDYIRLVKENCKDMITELEKTIATETDSVKESEKVIKLLEGQLASAKEELKAVKKQKVKELSNSPEDPELIEETYLDIEAEITHRIHGLQEQLKHNINKRGQVIEIARVSKTVFEVFDDILKKEQLTKVEIGLIVKKITVFESGIIEIKLRADIEQLLKTGTLPNEGNANFHFDSIGNSFNTKYIHKVRNQADKAYTVNVINEGDPLEIFTDRDGEVIFKKYSPIGEMSSFASGYAETLSKTIGFPVCISDKDSVIAVHGASKKEFIEKRVSSDLERIMDDKESFVDKGEKELSVIDGSKFTAGVVVPIISEGDTIGTVSILKDEKGSKMGEVEEKLASATAGFLAKQMEI